MHHRIGASKFARVITDPAVLGSSVLNLTNYLNNVNKRYKLRRFFFANLTTDQTSGIAPEIEKLKNLDLKAARAKLNSSLNTNSLSDGTAKATPE